jgi:3-dehydroquinate synthase
VVGDIGGFVAATYMRGIPYVQIPTTLLAQVDSSVGGKTAVNLPQGKNLVGAFYQPIGVLIDAAVLSTLPESELRAGMVEVIKYGIIRDAEFFSWLEANLAAVMSLDADAVLHAVRRSCEIKAAVVASDERESGLRAILNYGHTTGHAMEALSEYGVFRHGEAVAVGMEVAATLSRERAGLSETGAQRQHDLLERAGAPTRISGLSADEILSAMTRDKKAVGGKLRLVLAPRIGEVEICNDVPEDAVRQALVACGASS